MCVITYLQLPIWVCEDELIPLDPILNSQQEWYETASLYLLYDPLYGDSFHCFTLQTIPLL